MTKETVRNVVMNTIKRNNAETLFTGRAIGNVVEAAAKYFEENKCYAGFKELLNTVYVYATRANGWVYTYIVENLLSEWLKEKK